MATLTRYALFAGIGSFFVAGAINDMRDLLAHVQDGKPIPQCAVVSVTRPARCHPR